MSSLSVIWRLWSVFKTEPIIRRLVILLTLIPVAVLLAFGVTGPPLTATVAVAVLALVVSVGYDLTADRRL